MLRKEIHRLGYTAKFSLYDEKEVKRLMTQLARHLLEHEGDLPSLEPSIAKISSAKNRRREPMSTTNFLKTSSTDLHTCMRAYNAVDFDSLLSLTVKLFEDFPEVLVNYQERFRYIMIDEYQDTNPVQYRLASLLTPNTKIYASSATMTSRSTDGGAPRSNTFYNSTADCIVKLEQNYRSTPTILQAANAVISQQQRAAR